MITTKMIVDSLSKPNDYYDRCYKCNKLNTDGWGDEACTKCQAKTLKMYNKLGYTINQSGDLVKL